LTHGVGLDAERGGHFRAPFVCFSSIAVPDIAASCGIARLQMTSNSDGNGASIMDCSSSTDRCLTRRDSVFFAGFARTRRICSKAEGARVGGAILLPQQLRRYARALEFAMDHRPVWLRPPLLNRCRRPIKESLKCRVG
jgi:hypothetical protein